MASSLLSSSKQQGENQMMRLDNAHPGACIQIADSVFGPSWSNPRTEQDNENVDKIQHFSYQESSTHCSCRKMVLNLQSISEIAKCVQDSYVSLLRKNCKYILHQIIVNICVKYICSKSPRNNFSLIFRSFLNLAHIDRKEYSLF